MMTSLSDDDIERIAYGVIDRTLPKAEWTHAAHFAAALWIITQHGDEASREMPGLIRAYNEATGTPNTDTSGYHETITQASLRAAQSVMRAHEGAALSDMLAALMASEFGKSDWPLAYWRKTTLFSTEARRVWVEPDLQQLAY
jgi:hypothetical protein